LSAGAAECPAHDAFIRLLHRLEPDYDVLWIEVRPQVVRHHGVLVLDDSVLDKPYARKMELVTSQFPPVRARALVRRLRFCDTPKDGSWLNIAENELNSLTRQCVAGRLFGTLHNLQSEIVAWSTDVNKTQRRVDWQMEVQDARGRLKFLYPKIKL
jgi:hypothetical protein